MGLPPRPLAAELTGWPRHALFAGDRAARRALAQAALPLPAAPAQVRQRQARVQVHPLLVLAPIPSWRVERRGAELVQALARVQVPVLAQVRGEYVARVPPQAQHDG